MSDYWFRPKRFGFGATPTNWKGWVSSLVVVFALLTVMRFMIAPVRGGVLHPVLEVLLGLALIVVLVVGFSWFAKSKTDGEWHWRWGKDEFVDGTQVRHA